MKNNTFPIPHTEVTQENFKEFKFESGCYICIKPGDEFNWSEIFEIIMCNNTYYLKNINNQGNVIGSCTYKTFTNCLETLLRYGYKIYDIEHIAKFWQYKYKTN